MKTDAVMPALPRDWRARALLSIMLGFALAVAISAALPSHARAGQPDLSAVAGPLVRVDWQGPLSLPPRLRNHCHYDAFHEHYYCSDHCGLDYQFYFCTPISFGCCRPGYGYCDWKGRLRCAP